MIQVAVILTLLTAPCSGAALPVAYQEKVITDDRPLNAYRDTGHLRPESHEDRAFVRDRRRAEGTGEMQWELVLGLIFFGVVLLWAFIRWQFRQAYR